MASSSTKFRKLGKMLSSKSPSLMSDSSEVNSKWLQESIKEMEHNVKRMSELLEEDHNKPELINLAEGFYLKFCSLAERYNHLTRKLESRDRAGMSNIVTSTRLSSTTIVLPHKKMLGRPTSSKWRCCRDEVVSIPINKCSAFPRRSTHNSSTSCFDFCAPWRSECELDTDDDNDVNLDKKSSVYEDDTRDETEELHIHMEDNAEVSELHDQIAVSIDNLQDHDHEHRVRNESIIVIPIGEDNFDALKVKYGMLVEETDELYARVGELEAELVLKDDAIDETDERLAAMMLKSSEECEEVRNLKLIIQDLNENLKREKEGLKTKLTRLADVSAVFFFFGNLVALILVIGMVGSS